MDMILEKKMLCKPQFSNMGSHLVGKVYHTFQKHSDFKGALFIQVFLPVACTLFHVYWLTDTSLLSLHTQEILKGTRRFKKLIHIYEECLV